jgi:hypothetical protein
MKTIAVLIFCCSLSFSQSNPPRKTRTKQSDSTSAAPDKKTQGLSDDYAKAAIKYVVAVQNFESTASSISIMKAEEKIQSAKEDMEAAETAYACDEKVANVSLVACPEHLTSTFLEFDAFAYTLAVRTNHLSETADSKAAQDKQGACIDAWKMALQKRDSTQPKACSSDNGNTDARQRC